MQGQRSRFMGHDKGSFQKGQEKGKHDKPTSAMTPQQSVGLTKSEIPKEQNAAVQPGKFQGAKERKTGK
jgi:hypothetical protein